MQYVAYGNISQDIEQKEAIIEKLREVTDLVLLDDEVQSGGSQWQSFIDKLRRGDTAILYSFENAFVDRDRMLFFLKYCFAKHVRIVSLMDRLDTRDELFPESHTEDALRTLCRMLPKKKSVHSEGETEYSRSKSERKLRKYRKVINMYTAGYSIRDIMVKTGYKGKSSIFRILRLYDVDIAYPQKRRNCASSKSNAKR